MSHTDQHTPPWVRVLDPHLAVEHHDHRRGPCTLTPPDINAGNIRWYGDTWTSPYNPSCYWALPWWYIVENPSCGCPGCRGILGSPPANRRARTANRQTTRAAIREALNDEWLDEHGCPTCNTDLRSGRHIPWLCDR